MFHPLQGQFCYPKSLRGSSGVAEMKFTDRKVLNLKPKVERYEVFEGNGLGIRVTPKGTKSWVMVYRFQGKSRRMTLGKYPKMTVATAHKEFGRALDLLDHEVDPGTARVDENSETRKAPTVEGLVSEYMEKWAKPRKRSWAKDQSLLENDVIPVWGKRKANDITRRDVIKLLDKIVDRGAPIQANRTLAVVRKMFNFAISRDIVDVSPCAAVKAPAPENRRDRVLGKEEIKTFWLALDKAQQKRAPEPESQKGENKISMAPGDCASPQIPACDSPTEGRSGSCRVV